MSRQYPPARPPDSLALAGVAGQAGCVTLAVVLLSLVAGLWLDQQLGTRFIFTIVLLVVSAPVSIYLMVYIVLRGMERFHVTRGRVQLPSTEGQPIGGIWVKGQAEKQATPARPQDADDN